MVCRSDPWDKRPGAVPISDRASSKMDTAKIESSSSAGGRSVKTHLSSNKHCPTATRDRSEEKVQKKQPCKHRGLWWRRGKRCSKSWSRFPCSPWRWPRPSRLFPAAQEGQHGNRQPPCSRGLCPKGSYSPCWGCSWRAGTTQEQFLHATGGSPCWSSARVAMTKCYELTTTSPLPISLC